MSLKLEFVEKASQRSANVAALCREYKISRQTGHKWLKRFQEDGYAGLEESSRRPQSSPLATGEDIVAAIVALRVEQPRWGAKKLVVVLRRRFGDLTPSESTIDRVLRRFGQLRKRRRQRSLSVVEKAPEASAKEANDVWTIDFKGWWRAQNGQRCDPLTIRDAASRFVLAVKLLQRCSGEEVREVLTKLFRRYGVPKAIQCDNGTPFVCVRSRAGLTELSAWWVSLGIRIVRSRVGCPQDNGAHERMHVDLAADVQLSPQLTRVAQQRACDRWRQVFNHVRPHEALAGKTPGEVFIASPTKARVRPAVYPSSWIVRRVSPTGEIKHSGQTYYLSRSIRGHYVGLELIEGLRYRAWFYDVELGELELAIVTEQLALAG